MSGRIVFDERFLRYLGGTIVLLVLVAALVAMYHLASEVHIQDVRAALSAYSLKPILLALLFTVGGYITLSLYDRLALREIGKSVPYAVSGFAGFASYAISHTIGLSVLTSGSIRHRIYTPHGLSTADVVQLTSLCSLTYGLAATLILALTLLLEPGAIADIDRLPDAVNRIVGAAVLVALAAYVFWTGMASRRLELLGWRFPLPRTSTTLGQIALGSCDILFASATLYALQPASLDISFLAFTGIFTAAFTLGFVSHVPGGIGVFETAMLLALPSVPPDHLLASLLVFRVIYYLLPFSIAALATALFEARRASPAIQRVGQTGVAGLQAIAPALIGALVMLAGIILLISGATPAASDRIAVLSDWIPLPIVEMSHLVASIVGVFLLILARGLFHRLDGAYHVTMLLLGGGVLASLAKGLDYEAAILMAVTAGLLFLGRGAFYRRSSLLDEPFSAAWLFTIGGVLAMSFAIGMFAYKHVNYSHDLWWEFAYEADASRFLRAALAVLVAVFAYFSLRLLRPVRPVRSSDTITDQVRGLVSQGTDADHVLALTGDKRFLLSANGDAFLMYAVSGRTWVSLGDPVGNEAAWPDLLWDFRTMVDRYDGWPAFYQVHPDSLHHYLDVGLSVIKLGETAEIDLKTFTLEGAHRKDLRSALNRAKKEGLSFEVMPREQVANELSVLRRISDDWLSNRHMAEKGFSVGYFDDAYISHCECAAVRNSDGEVIAFANLLASGDRHELSIDLMRHLRSAPHGTMDFLFANLLLWGKEKGFNSFSLGMAPLSGLEDRALAPTWAQIGTLIFRHGGHFYNFEGLRAYKQKFAPAWSPRYLASPGGIALPRILLDISALIGRSH